VKSSNKPLEDYIEQLIYRISSSTKPGLRHALTEVSEEEYDMVQALVQQLDISSINNSEMT